jgi:IPT/TIG domain
LPKRTDVWIAAGLFASSLALLGPWAILDFSNQPWNNGFIYTAIARMFRDRASMWNGLQYGGSPFHFLYPPLFPTAVALLRFLSIGRAFHAVSAIGYALAPVCLYVLGRQLFRTRLPAVFAALAYAVFPSLVYALPLMRVLVHPYAFAPWSFVALVGYDEAPHAFALPFMLLAVAAAWRERWTLAAFLAGAVFLTSWPGLIGLCFPLAGLAVARWRNQGLVRSMTYVAGLTGAAYGVAAFWITPAYVVASQLYNRIVWRHIIVTAPWNRTTWMLLTAALVVVSLAAWKRTPPELALVLVWSALAGLVVLSFLMAGNYLLPLPHRYLLEMSAGLALLAAALVSLLPKKAMCVVGAVLIAAGAAFSYRFATHAWKFEPAPEDPRRGVAYQIAMWLEDHVRGARVMASGELDSSLDLWTGVAQVGGPGQDPRNFLTMAAERQIAFGCGADSERIAELWLRALNAPWLVVHGAASREYFHWYAQPDKFAVLPVAWDNRAGDRVYRLPNYDPHEAVVVDLVQLPRLTTTSDADFLEAYVKWSAGKRPVGLQWRSSGQAEFDVNLRPNEAVLLKVNQDPGWHASGASIERDPIGFQLIRLPPGSRHVDLRFGASWDVWLGRAITVLTILLLLARVKPIWIAAAVLIPAAIAWAVLLAGIPSTAQVAEEAFIRLHPPMINLNGIVDNTTSQQPPLGRGRLVSIYGINFAGTQPSEPVRVWIGDRAVQPEFVSPGQINVSWPADAPPSASVSVEVNGCIGNAFTVSTR